MAMQAAHESLKQLYVDQLRDLYNAEQQILKALPKMEEKAQNSELKNAFRMHYQQTQDQVGRLERIFDALGERASGEKCKGMEGLITESQHAIKMYGDSMVLDAALIAEAQRVEHYEIAGYGCVRTYANLLGLGDQEQLLQQTLNEEGQTDHKLTEIAEKVVNIKAMRAD